jgi:hypothetical protein
VAPPAGEGTEQAEGQPARGGGGFGGFGGGRPVNPGTYRVVLTVDGKELSQTVRVEADPDAHAAGVAEEGRQGQEEPDDDEEEEEERMEREGGAVIRD